MIFKSLNDLIALIYESPTLAASEKKQMISHCKDLDRQLVKLISQQPNLTFAQSVEQKYPFATHLLDTIARTCSRLGV